jgi:cytochrome b6-f complex iron-sulfur subunit
MNREEFLIRLGSTVFAACAGCSLAACSSDDEPASATIDLTLDLSTAQYSALNNVGGSVNVNNIIVARISSSSFAALSRCCTHQVTPINYRPAEKDFYCPNHGSVFSTTGAVRQGPASKPLTQYRTELNGTLLRVFS